MRDERSSPGCKSRFAPGQDQFSRAKRVFEEDVCPKEALLMKYISATDGDWLQCPGYAKKILLTEDDLNQKGALVQLIRISPHTSTAKHFHKHCTEVFHVIRGSGTFVIEGKTIRMKLGDTLSCEPREIHTAKNDGDEPLVYVVFKTNAVADDIHWV